MRISARRLGVAAVIDINGPIEGRAGGRILVGVREQIRAGYELVVLNLERVPSVDLAGLGTLVESFVAMRKSGGQLRLAGITRSLQDLVVITRLLTVFDTFESVEEAIAGSELACARTPPAVRLSPDGLAAIHRFLRHA